MMSEIDLTPLLLFFSSYRGMSSLSLCVCERTLKKMCGVNWIRSSASLLISEWTEKEGGEVYLVVVNAVYVLNGPSVQFLAVVEKRRSPCSYFFLINCMSLLHIMDMDMDLIRVDLYCFQGDQDYHP